MRLTTHTRIRSLLLLLMMIAMIMVGCTTKTRPSPLITGLLPIKTTSVITAGTPVNITVGPVSVSDGTTATLLAVGSYGPRIYQTVFHHGTAQFLLAGEETQQSGLVQLTVLVANARGTTQLLIQPSAPVEPLSPLIGARAIIADGQHWSMTVLIPFDAFGNPIMEGTQLEVLVLHPGNRLEKKLLVIHNLVAWTRVFSGVRAGRTLIVARIGQIHGFEGTLVEVAGWPVPFNLSASPATLPADGHLLTTISTTVIQDKFGNVVPDGTLITFTVHAPSGTITIVPAYTLGGIAQISLQAPQKQGNYRVQASLPGVFSNSLTIPFSAGLAVNVFALALQRNAPNHDYLLQAGPLLGGLGQYIPDSTPVRFIIRDSRGQVQEMASTALAGYAHIELVSAQFPKGDYTVQVVVGSAQATLQFRLD